MFNLAVIGTMGVMLVSSLAISTTGVLMLTTTVRSELPTLHFIKIPILGKNPYQIIRITKV
jgi:hypothetical protein